MSIDEPQHASARRTKRCTGEASTGKAAVVSLCASIGDVELERILSFLLAEIQTLTAIAPVSRRIAECTHHPGSWEGAKIYLSRRFLDFVHICTRVSAFSSPSWKLAAEVCLSPHPIRSRVKQIIEKSDHSIKITVEGHGPFGLFCMPSYGRPVNMLSSLHFFEPRYLWLVDRVLQADGPKVFGWITSFAPKLSGVLCRIETVERAGGGYDVHFLSMARIVVVESWEEAVPRVPRAPPLLVGYVEADDARGAGTLDSILEECSDAPYLGTEDGENEDDDEEEEQEEEEEEDEEELGEDDSTAEGAEGS